MNTVSPVKVWRNQKKIASLIGKRGIIESYTLIYVPPNGFENQAPYAVALARFGNAKITAQVVDSSETDIKIGQTVKVVLRRVKSSDKEGVIPYGAKFKIIK